MYFLGNVRSRTTAGRHIGRGRSDHYNRQKRPACRLAGSSTAAASENLHCSPYAALLLNHYVVKHRSSTRDRRTILNESNLTLAKSQRTLEYPCDMRNPLSRMAHEARTARWGGTANQGRQSARGSRNPAEYDRRFNDLFEEIITTPKRRLVQ